MTIDNQETAVLKFKSELLSVFRRWLEESDLGDMELVEATVEVMNAFCEEDAVQFEADPDFLDKLEE